LVLLFTSGWGFYGLLLDYNIEILEYTAYLDFLDPEAHLFYSMYLYPHFLAAIILNVLVYIFFLRYMETKKKKNIYLVSSIAFILGFIHLYEIITIYTILTPFLLFKWWQTKNFQHYIRNMIPFYIISALPLMYHLWLMFVHESYGALGTTVLLSPPVFSVLFAFGIFSFLSLFCIVAFVVTRSEDAKYVFPKHFNRLAQKHQDAWLFLIFWITFNFLLLYLPIPPQRRFIMGLQIPFVIPGSIALFYILVPYVTALIRFLKKPFARDDTRKNLSYKVLIGLWVVIFVLHLPSVLWVFHRDYALLRDYQSPADNNPQYYYVSQKIYEGLEYVKKANLTGTILTNSFVGNWLPTLNANRVYQGHASQTLEREQKMRDYQKFINQTETAEEKYAFLQKNNISYVVYVDEEVKAASFKDPRYLKLVHGTERVEIYEVLRGPAIR